MSFRISIGLASLASCLAMLAPAADAATIPVDITVDELDNGFGDTGCSLREAVKVANENADFGECNPTGGFAGADTIVVQSDLTYLLTRHGPPGVDNTNVNGDLDIDGQTVIRPAGAGLATIDADSSIFPGPAEADRDRAIHIEPTAGAVTLERLRVTGGFVTAPTIGALQGGGGILIEAPLTVIDSEISDNLVDQPQVFNDSIGGGLLVKGAGRLTMTGSTVEGNVARGSSVNQNNGIGGGVAAFTSNSSASVTITNSTVSGNSAQPGPAGGVGVVGGIFTGGTSPPQVPTTLTNVTVTGNSAPGGVGGIQVPVGTLTGNVIAANIDPTGKWPDCGLTPTGSGSGGGNLIGERGFDGACAFTGPNDSVGADGSPIPPMLGLLLDNEGPTRTHTLNPGSPALNRGGSCPATDQRGFFRFSAPPCDAGALEVGASETPPPPTQTSVTPGASGQRAAALKKCKKKKSKAKRRKCRAAANKLPV